MNIVKKIWLVPLISCFHPFFKLIYCYQNINVHHLSCSNVAMTVTSFKMTYTDVDASHSVMFGHGAIPRRQIKFFIR